MLKRGQYAPHCAMNTSRLLGYALCLPLCASTLMAEETVRDVGTAFTCYYQNKGDNKYAGSTTDPCPVSAADWTEEQMAAVERALLTWDAAIDNTPVRRLQVGVYWVDFAAQGSPGALASAYSMKVAYYVDGPATVEDATVAEGLWREGVDDSYTDAFDLRIFFNVDTNYYLGADATGISAGQYDMETVTLHEVGHTLGFMSLAKSDGTFYHLYSDTVHHTALDGLMVDAEGNRIVDEAAADADHIGFTTGEALRLEGTELGVYNPYTWQDGSSMVHVTGDEDAVMQMSMDTGTVRRELAESEIQLMSAMGWDMAEQAAGAVPEAGATALSLLGLLTLALRRRRSRAS